VNIVYFAVGQEFAEQAELAAEAMRLSNPDAEAWCITDANTSFKSLQPYRVPIAGPSLIYDRLLDSDCVVNGPMQGVFKGPVSVTERKPPGGCEDQIYNGGVLYAEGDQAVRFWQAWADQFIYVDRNAWAWWGDQLLLPLVVEHYKRDVSVYWWETHNYIPTKFVELAYPLQGKHIVHFKGKRKPWLPYYVDSLKEFYGAQSLQRFAH
jgi:hypothetical protein